MGIAISKLWERLFSKGNFKMVIIGLDNAGIILVVDSTDRERMGSVKGELQRLIAQEELANAVVLVLANKQDLHDAMSAAEISESLALHAVQSHEWHIQACCALTGEGLTEGLEWIARRLRA
ncbi:ADP-ribosylation factor family-domain-containing protein [Baffinella frigidus]|nr:ADP-ribosylation factor family-domain-containing protein [Cryptophyta sp. CCMP2293]